MQAKGGTIDLDLFESNVDPDEHLPELPGLHHLVKSREVNISSFVSKIKLRDVVIYCFLLFATMSSIFLLVGTFFQSNQNQNQRIASQQIKNNNFWRLKRQNLLFFIC